MGRATATTTCRKRRLILQDGENEHKFTKSRCVIKQPAQMLKPRKARTRQPADVATKSRPEPSKQSQISCKIDERFLGVDPEEKARLVTYSGGRKHCTLLRWMSDVRY